MQKTIIGLAGEMASGKDTVALYLAARYGAVKYRFSDVLRETLDRLALPQSRENLTLLATHLWEAFGKEVLVQGMIRKAEQSLSEVIVIDGIRAESDIAALEKQPGFTLWYVGAPSKTRYTRLVARNQNAGDSEKTFMDFEKDHELPTEREVPMLRERARSIIDNDGTLEDLYRQVDAAWQAMKQL